MRPNLRSRVAAGKLYGVASSPRSGTVTVHDRLGGHHGDEEITEDVTDHAPVSQPMTPRIRRALAGMLGVLLVGLTQMPISAASGATQVPTVTLTVGPRVRAIPDDFFGLSIEVDKLAAFADAGDAFDRILAILRATNGKPLLLRLGGRSADAAIWGQKPASAPRWVFGLGDSWMSTLAGLVRRDNLQVELNLNLAIHSPSMGLAFAEAAQRALPRGGLAGLAVGNEPDLYRLQPRLEKERITSTTRSTPTHWTRTYNAARYVSDFNSYASTIRRHLPGVPLAGPELTYPSLDWPTKLIALGSRRPDSLSFHRYATATCTSKQRRAVPDAAAFLENRFAGGLARTLATDLKFAVVNQIPLRVSEMNSFTCGGRSGLAASFATALWAPDALFEMARMGVAAINWHIRPELANAPFGLDAQGVTAHPEAYGLAVFTRMLGPSAQLVRVRNDAPDALSIKTWGVSSRHGTAVLAINKGPQTVLTLVHALRARDARVSRLLGPSPAALTGETLAGQTIGADGRWHGERTITSVRGVRGLYPVRLPAYSAVLVTL